MLGAKKQARFAKALARGAPAVRKVAVRELENLAVQGAVSPREKKTLGLVILANFHLRPPSERRILARFLDVWFVTETSRRLSRRLEATRLEEVEPDIRESLKVASITTLPHPDLIEAIEHPSRENLTEGLGLLIILETVYSHLRHGTFPHRHLPALIRALCTARGHRASHIAKPFLWRLEYVLETAMKMGSYLLH